MNNLWQVIGGSSEAVNVRERLTADRIYYVSTTGSDSENNGLTPGSAFATLQHVADVIINNLDIGPYNVDVQFADGSYSSVLISGQQLGWGAITFKGNAANKSLVKFIGAADSPNRDAVFAVWFATNIHIQDIHVENAFGDGIHFSFFSQGTYKNIEFGACLFNHIDVDTFASLSNDSGTSEIIGSAGAHISVSFFGGLGKNGGTTILTGTPHFTNFVYGEFFGLLFDFSTYSGPATGVRYWANFRSIFDTGGSGQSFFPGDTPGKITAGGSYDGSRPIEGDLTTQTGATYTVSPTDSSIIANRAGTVTLTLPAAATYSGRILTIKTIQAQTVVSDTSNVAPLAGGSAGTAILAATAGKWAQLQSDGSNWLIMASN